MKKISDVIKTWANDKSGPVALYLKQRLLPVGEENIVYPPTYADIGYNIDTLSDGTKVALIDSIGSQANRMEPIFKREPYSGLVPAVEIELRNGKNISLLDLAHRSADATVQASPKLAEIVNPAFDALRKNNNAARLCEVAPTSLVFGFWDSRGDSKQKRPRLVRSIIRAWDVEVLHAAAQFNSIWKELDEGQQNVLKDKKSREKDKRSSVGLADAPSVFRTDKLKNIVGTSFNPEARVLGGVRVNGVIERHVTINLVALRSLGGNDEEDAKLVKQYLLTLTLIAATAEMDLYLREGCLLKLVDEKDTWLEIPRRGDPKECGINSASSEDQDALLQYARNVVKRFKEKWPDQESFTFDVKEAKKLLQQKKVDDDED